MGARKAPKPVILPYGDHQVNGPARLGAESARASPPPAPGHWREGFTLDTYAHVLDGMQEEAAAKVDVALGEILVRHTRK